MFERGSIVILGNSDLYFDDSIKQLKFAKPYGRDDKRQSKFILAVRWVLGLKTSI